MGLAYYALRRLLWTAGVGFGVLTFTFIFLRLSGSPADRYLATLGVRSSPEAIREAVELRYGLDRPLWEQYAGYLGNLLRGDWGWSFSASRPVSELIGVHWVYSAQLIGLALLVGVPLGVWLGSRAAFRAGSRFDRGLTLFSFAGVSLPTFWLGLMLLLVFGVRLRWFPTFFDTSAPPLSWGHLRSLVLPVATLAVGVAAGYARYGRASVLEHKEAEHVRWARARGLPEGRVRRRYVLRNAMLPLSTFLLLDLAGAVFGGAYLTEAVFGVPGLGRLSLDAIRANDYPVVVAVTLVSTLVVLVANLAADLLYRWLDPRVEHG